MAEASEKFGAPFRYTAAARLFIRLFFAGE